MIKFIKEQKKNLEDILKLLIYKEDLKVFEKLGFDNDSVYLEPLLFSYFNNKKDNLLSKEILEETVQGYFIKNKKLNIKHSFNKNDISYIPNLGYFDRRENLPFEPIHLIKNTCTEVLRYPIKLLNSVFISASNGKIDSSNCGINNELFNKNITYLTNAFHHIKDSSHEQYELIEQCCKKILLFKTNPENTNSFATINAHGIAFLNVYQEDYDEVFFIDDIAHQTGHIILNTLLFSNKLFFKIDENQGVEKLLKEKDHRTIKTLVHALYTYYTTFLCLDNCIVENLFDEKQTKEAIARIGFYLQKCTIDLTKFSKINLYYKGIDNVLTNNGIDFYKPIKNKYIEMITKWKETILKYDYRNQPYNFEYKKFNKLNKEK